MEAGFHSKTPASSRHRSKYSNAYSLTARTASVAMPRPQKGSPSQ